MSDTLYKMFCEKYPPIGLWKTSRITLYPSYGGGTWIERIHLNLLEKIFLEFLEKRKPLIKSDDIGKLAKKIFDDINYDFYTHREEGNVIFFRPEGIDKYSQNYAGHYIAVHEPLIIPKILISTGNRGAIGLHNKQREKYFQFVDELYDIFLKNAKSGNL